MTTDQKPKRWKTSSCPPILKTLVPSPGEMKGRHHSFLAPDLTVSEEKGGAAGGWLLENQRPFDWQKRSCRYCGLGDPKGIGCHDLVLGVLAVWAPGHRESETSPSTML